MDRIAGGRRARRHRISRRGPRPGHRGLRCTRLRRHTGTGGGPITEREEHQYHDKGCNDDVPAMKATALLQSSRFELVRLKRASSRVSSSWMGRGALMNYAGQGETIVFRRVARLEITNWEASHGKSKPAVRHKVD